MIQQSYQKFRYLLKCRSKIDSKFVLQINWRILKVFKKEGVTLEMIKKIKVVMVLVILSVILALPVSADSNTIKLKVTLLNDDLVENDSVGDEWYSAAYVNGKRIVKGRSITLNLKSTESLRLKAYAEEQDTTPDKGSAHSSIKVSSIKKSVTKLLNVNVTENQGEFKGNSAKWSFKFKIQK